MVEGAGDMIQFFLLVSRQGKCRLSKWYAAYSDKVCVASSVVYGWMDVGIMHSCIPACVRVSL